MVSVEEARLILQDNQTSDEEIQEIIDSLQLLAELMFDKWREERKLQRAEEEASK